MSHLYFADRIEDGCAYLEGEQAAHLARVLRCRPGDAVPVTDGTGTEYDTEAAEVTPQRICLRILSARPCASEPSLAVTLYVGLPKGDRFGIIVQKATELGAAGIVPFESRFCVAKPKNEEAKLQRFRRIALEAAKQAGRGRVPAVGACIPFAEALKQAAAADAALFCYEGGGAPLAPGTDLHARLCAARTAAVLTGSEGGFSAEEAAAAAAAGCTAVTLGPRILRCETAPAAALTAVMTLTGNLR